MTVTLKLLSDLLILLPYYCGFIVMSLQVRASDASTFTCLKRYSETQFYFFK